MYYYLGLGTLIYLENIKSLSGSNNNSIILLIFSQHKTKALLLFLKF